MSQSLPQRLRRIHSLLGPLAARAEVVSARCAEFVRQAHERLLHDLLPRTAGASEYLVLGIVGPNNAGKSALFNALAGARLSPSVPTGGATRRLIGALHPNLLQRLQEEPTLSRLALRVLQPAPEGVALALCLAQDPNELDVVCVEHLPSDILLIDTPDFDSILSENRAASEALLRVVDLALVVITRHTYQNKEVVHFLRSWLAHGRPWVCVYNESIGAEITLEHAAKLALDLGSPPQATFHAPFDLGIQSGARSLEPHALAGLRTSPGESLTQWLYGLGAAVELKRAALASSLNQLRADLQNIVRNLAEVRAEATEVLALAQTEAQRLGRLVALEAMPMGPFLEAFRAVLDRRPSALQRGLRGALRGTRMGLERALAKLPYTRKRPPAATAPSSLVEAERAALARAWPPFFETLALELAPGGRFWREREPPAGALRRALEEDLSAAASSPARERAQALLSEDPAVMRAFQQACEELIEAELDGGGREWMLQWAVDALHLLPLVAAGIVIVKTGGLGADVAVAGAGTFSTLVAEKLSKLLGSEVARTARQRWQKLRSARLAEIVLQALGPQSMPLLKLHQQENDSLAAELAREEEGLPWEATPSATT